MTSPEGGPTAPVSTVAWLRDAVERSKGRSAPIFEEARRRGISQREFHCALDAAGLDFAEFGEKIIRRARTAAKPSGAPASKTPPAARPAKRSAEAEARGVQSFAAVAHFLRERRRTEEAAAAAAAAKPAVKPAPAAQFNPRELWAKYSTRRGNVFGGRRRQSR